MMIFTLIGIFSIFNAISAQSCTTGQKLTHATALSYIRNAGIGIWSSGGCSNAALSYCTSLENIRCRSIAEIVNYKKVSGCAVTITGGTETGHASGTQSHANGYKIDISLSTCNDNYIKGKFTYAGQRGDGAALYKDTRGNTFAREGNHWDILFP